MAEQGSPGGNGRPQRSTNEAEEVRVGWRMAGLGTEVAASAMGGALLGWLFDQWRGKGNTGVLIGAGVGILTGLWALVRGGLKLNRQLDEAMKRKRQQGRAGPTAPPPPARPDKYEQALEETWNDWDDDDNWSGERKRSGGTDDEW